MNDYGKLLQDTFDGLVIKKLEPLGQGKAGIICLVNGEIVFKIPLAKDGAIALWQKNEGRVLKFLEGKLDVEIPRVLYEGTSPCGRHIIGETLLSGVPFSYDLCDTYRRETQLDIQRQLGRIVRQLHDVGGHDFAWQPDMPPATLEERLAEFAENFSPQVRGMFTAKEVAQIEAIGAQYREISIAHPVRPVLCHHDLHYFNLMVEPATQRISGLLDFGCASYSEPARDWHYYFDAQHVLAGYGDNGDVYFPQRQRFHALAHMLGCIGDGAMEYVGFVREYMLA